MLIDCSYFMSGTRHIRNASLGAFPNANETNAFISGYIDTYQEEYLRKMLGTRLGSEVHLYLVTVDKNELAKRRSDFDKVCCWLKEPFADYLFFHIIRDSDTQATITGFVRLKNADKPASPFERQVSIWNRMVDRHICFDKWAHSGECPVEGVDVSWDMMTKINRFNI